MDGQHKQAAALRRSVRQRIGFLLRRLYDTLRKEPVPDRVTNALLHAGEPADTGPSGHSRRDDI